MRQISYDKRKEYGESLSEIEGKKKYYGERSPRKSIYSKIILVIGEMGSLKHKQIVREINRYSPEKVKRVVNVLKYLEKRGIVEIVNYSNRKNYKLTSKGQRIYERLAKLEEKLYK